jgi:hypothetical protein
MRLVASEGFIKGASAVDILIILHQRIKVGMGTAPRIDVGLLSCVLDSNAIEFRAIVVVLCQLLLSCLVLSHFMHTVLITF